MLLLRSFGTVLYEMLELKRLVEGRKAQVISFLINFKDHKIHLDTIPAKFMPILKRTLILSAEQRNSTNNILELLMVLF